MSKPNTLPVVAIVGRSNVGKSTLFNKIAEKKGAVVSAMAGTTRDRLSTTIKWENRSFNIIDTGGLDLGKNAILQKDILAQSEQAILDAGLILLIVDAKTGLVPADEVIIKKLRKQKTPILLVVNKCDTKIWREKAEIFRRFRLPLITVSAATGAGVGDLLDEIAKLFPVDKNETTKPLLRLAIIGKPNVGKSSLLNALCGEERMIVSPIPHTTRDAQDVIISHRGIDFTVIDTAGIRRADDKADEVEHISIGKAKLAIKQADVVALVVDISKEITSQDKRLSQEVTGVNKGLIIVANKWDLIPDKAPETINKYERYINQSFPYLAWAPIIFTSAIPKSPPAGENPLLSKEGQGVVLRGGGRGVKKILDLAEDIYKNLNKEISKQDLAMFCNKAVARRKPTIGKGTRRPTLLSLKQVDVRPPRFILNIPVKTNLSLNYKQFLINSLRYEFDLEGVPIKLTIKEVMK